MIEFECDGMKDGEDDRGQVLVALERILDFQN